MIFESTIPSVTQEFGPKDLILYALGLGYGENPLEREELRFVYERDLKIVPSICSVLCRSSSWMRDLKYKIDWRQVVHAQESFTIHKPIPPAGTLRGCFEITGIEDKGPGKGAVLYLKRGLYDAASDDLLAITQSALLLRNDGGRGGFGQPSPARKVLPERAPHRELKLRSSARAALIYRLSGDMNPLHVDPEAARRAGFDRPILHGLCTSGMACRAVLSTYCAHDPGRLSGMSARFTRPVYPGETLKFDFWQRPGLVEFRVRAIERDVIVLEGWSFLRDNSEYTRHSV